MLVHQVQSYSKLYPNTSYKVSGRNVGYATFLTDVAR